MGCRSDSRVCRPAQPAPRLASTPPSCVTRDTRGRDAGCKAEPARSAADAAARLLPPAASCIGDGDMWADPLAVWLISQCSILIIPAGC